MAATTLSQATSSTIVTPLRDTAPMRVVDGFGRSVAASSRFVSPRNHAELLEVIAAARAEKLPITFRGSGRSYGDASINEGGIVVDVTQLRRVVSWDPETGILVAEPGVTVEDLWRRGLVDGFWPAVVPGTMRPTLGGCLGMNIHGKNNFKQGPFGDHVLGFTLVTADGREIPCSRDENPETFHAAIGGLGLLGAITNIRLQMHKVESGFLRVEAMAAPNLEGMFAMFRERLPHSDYLVGWVDGTAEGGELGRGEIHQANYLTAAEDPASGELSHTEIQGLPSTILGVPKSILWRFLRPFMSRFFITFVNSMKYFMSKLNHGKTYIQSHVAFAFLLDYVPNWRLAYGDRGFIQYQVFIPDGTALDAMKAIFEASHRAGMPPYLAVLKRHRPDKFLLSHALDGWSMAMDFPVPADRNALTALTDTMTQIVLKAGGRFYMAKDSVLRPEELKAAYGEERLSKFRALKAELDPDGLFETALSKRLELSR